MPKKHSRGAGPRKQRNTSCPADMTDDELIDFITTTNSLTPSDMLSAELRFFFSGRLSYQRYLRPKYLEQRELVSEIKATVRKSIRVAARIDQLKDDQRSLFAWQLEQAAARAKLDLPAQSSKHLSSRLGFDQQQERLVHELLQVAKETNGRTRQRKRDLHQTVLIGLVAVIVHANGGKIDKMTRGAHPTAFQKTCYELIRRRKQKRHKEPYLDSFDTDSAEPLEGFSRRTARLFEQDHGFVERVHRVTQIERNQPKNPKHVPQNFSVWVDLLSGLIPISIIDTC